MAAEPKLSVELTRPPAADGASANWVVDTILEAFVAYHNTFKHITHRARRRFEQCDWSGLHQDAEERLDLYNTFVQRAVGDIKRRLGEEAQSVVFWEMVKDCYMHTVARRDDFELAESFFNSVSMRVVSAGSLDPRVTFVGSEFEMVPREAATAIYTTYVRRESTAALIRDLLLDCRFDVPYQNLDRTTEIVAREIDRHVESLAGRPPISCLEVAKPIFYRGKSAYLAGRIHTAGPQVPFVLALLNTGDGVCADAVLMTEDEVSIIFSFTRSYFHVEIEQPYALVQFLRTIMPRKRIAELYISLGYNKHGKTELYRDLMRHLEQSTDKFERAPGERGMVMMVFTLPSYDVVFKIIKDRFDYPKQTTRQEVMDRYQLVFRHDRGGRLVDAQEFEHLRFARDRFAPELLDELLRVGANTVSVEGDEVVIKHLYAERRLTPLNLYVHEADRESSEEAVIDYGQAIKDLAATNVFPGDLLLKNFGVTRHGRVVFYDYDELVLLTDCTFREMPQSDEWDDDLAAEPWFSVGENDVFPEELVTFLGLPPPLRRVFTQAHGELFGVPFWTDLQKRLGAGEFLDIFPYKESRRLSA